MQVKLVGITRPEGVFESVDVPGVSQSLNPEEFIVYMARVSSPSNQMKTETAPKLLTYLIRKGHWSPFDMIDMLVEVETSRAIAAQILRHWSFRFQEFSQRYAVADLGFEIYEARLQDPKNRQGSIAEVPPDVADWWRYAQRAHAAASKSLYEDALRRGLAKELARMVLPLSTRTRLYIKGSVRSWMFYLKSRTAAEAQKEHREIAVECQALFREKFPATYEASRVLLEV